MDETSKDVEKYISCSKVNINNYIRKNEYNKAFWLLILFLERLDDKEKVEVVDYYSNHKKQLGVLNNTFSER